ncbi:MAG: hypothetical protein ACRDPX_03350 [Gaiellaceae bacterium]
MRTRLPLLALVSFLALVAVGGGWALLARNSGNGTRYVSEHPTAVPETARVVTISARMPQPSTHVRRLSAMLEAGAMPHEPTMAEVLTDTDCAPDEHRVSRCRNEMHLANGHRIVLRHPHDMSEVPCLAPGERVLLVPTST